MIPCGWLLQAQTRISIQLTHTQFAQGLYNMCANLRVAGSFKTCRAMARYLSLKGREIYAGFVTDLIGNLRQGLGLNTVMSIKVTARPPVIVVPGGNTGVEFFAGIESCFSGITI